MKPAVLIVDDEFGLAELLCEVLQAVGYGVEIAINGERGLAALQERRPDLVLLDVMMPIMDGVEMLAAMRADPRFADIPVVMMTAIPERLDRGELDCQGLLRKPFGTKDLFAMLRSILGERAL